MLSLPGTSPRPVRPALSLRMTTFRVKNGPCAPARFSSMLSYPATGITCMPVMRGVIIPLPPLACPSIDLPSLLSSARPRRAYRRPGGRVGPAIMTQAMDGTERSGCTGPANFAQGYA
jgi:hypothetical protein